jgi:hypothetical protein
VAIAKLSEVDEALLEEDSPETAAATVLERDEVRGWLSSVPV